MKEKEKEVVTPLPMNVAVEDCVDTVKLASFIGLAG